MSLFSSARRYRLRMVVMCLFTGITTYSQDIHLSQFFNTPLLRNPALAGIFNGDIRIETVYRNQWGSVAYPYKTNALSAEYRFAVGETDDYMTVGVASFYDQAGINRLKTLQVMPAINFHKNLGGEYGNYLSGGFMAGFVNRQFDGKNLTFDNQYNGGHFDPYAPTGEQFTGLSRTVFDVAVGLSFNSHINANTVYYVGASLWHFNEPSLSFLDAEILLNKKWQFNAGIKTNLSPQLELTVEGNHLIQGPYSQTIAAGWLMYNLAGETNDEDAIKIGGGSGFRLNDAIIPFVQLQYKKLQTTISYDVNTSPLKTASQGQGGFELSLSYRAFTSYQSPLVKSMRCPRF